MSESKIRRFGVSMDEELLRRFDRLIQQKKYENRSEAVRDLVREALVRQSWEDDEAMVAGSILLFYRHSQGDIMEELTDLQHHAHHIILATTHFHLDENHCLEIIVVKGKAKEIRALSDRMISLKGVDYGKFTVAPYEG